jgi:hypothetical protein
MTFLLAAALVALGIAMICVAVWLVRATRTDTPALGPLEVMGDRSFHRHGDDARQRALTAARPPGAEPPAPMLERDEVVAELPPARDGDAGTPAEPQPVVEAAPVEHQSQPEPVAAAPDAVTVEEPAVVVSDVPDGEPQPAESA